MEPERTELTWSYEPADFFETPYQHDYDAWRLSIADVSGRTKKFATSVIWSGV